MPYISKFNIDNTEYNVKDKRMRDLYDITAAETQHLLNNDYVLGLEVDYENKTFTRLAAAESLSPGNDFNSFNMYGGRRLCNLADDGTVNAWYGESGYIEDGSNGQVMVYQPKFYYKVEPLKLDSWHENCYHLRKARYYVSDLPLKGFKLHPAFRDKNGNEIDGVFDSAYEGCIYDVSASSYITDDSQIGDFTIDRLSSISNVKPVSGHSQDLTRANAEQLAQNRGEDWHITPIQLASAEQLLIIIEYGSCNLQDTLGMGVVNKASGDELEITGSTSFLGNNSGSASGTDGLVNIRWRGKENPYGNIWKFINGLTMNDGAAYIKLDYDLDEGNLENYIKTFYYITSGSGGFISAFSYDSTFDWLFIPSEFNGNSSLPIGDSSNIWNSGLCVARLGGSWAAGTYVGSFSWALHTGLTDRYRAIGGRAAYIPTNLNHSPYLNNSDYEITS